jgi:hypothetical protein
MSKQNIIIGVGIAIAIILSVVALVSNKQSVPSNVRGASTVQPGQSSNFNEVGFNVDYSLVQTGYKKLTINSGEFYATAYNNTGGTIIVDSAIATISGVASSTFRFYVGTTTQASDLPLYTAATTTPTLGLFVIATSTNTGSYATTTAPWSGDRIQVANGEMVYFLVQNTYGKTCSYDGSHATSQNCESATSTSRWVGDSANLLIHYTR